MRQHLVLVPTELERDLVEPVLTAALGGKAAVALCGFGPVAAAARTARLLADRRPAGVVLLGIAGRYTDRLAIGGAYAFERVACHGIGAGTGAAHVPAATMGWPHWPGDGLDPATRIGDVLSCAGGLDSAPCPRAGLLVSACAAAAGDADVRERLRLHPGAEAEDMEGFAVATACRLAGVPLDVVRGISNTAGDRDRGRWRVADACRAAAEAVAAILGGRS